jgi:hypothetical protein
VAEQLVGQVVFVGLSELQPAYLAVAGVIAALAVAVRARLPQIRPVRTYRRVGGTFASDLRAG